jgi:GNAT superfamily N-acetyltransferase
MDDVQLAASADGVGVDDLDGFFVGWPEPPSPERRLAILLAADEVVVARCNEKLIGFVTAITDGVFAASIPLVEVLPEWQGRGIGRLLMNAMLDRLAGCYAIDLACDDDVVAFYERLGGTRLNAMSWRNHHRLAR